MNRLQTVRILVAMLVCILPAPGVRAQQVETKVENAEVVYVEGNDIILKLTNGKVLQFEVPDSSRFTIDGRDMTVHELKPGMKLTALITTANTPRWVDTVNVVEIGTVVKTVGSNLIIKTPEGENRMYRVPSTGKITLQGKEIAVNQLREGDKITATVVTTRAPLEASKAAKPVVRTPATPARVGVLLIDEGNKPVEPHGIWGTPTTISIVVVILLATVLVTVLAIRRKRKA